MAVHDHDRSARDYMRDARTNYDDADPITKFAGVAVGVLLLGIVLFMFLAAPAPDPARNTVQQAPTTTTAPTTQPQ